MFNSIKGVRETGKDGWMDGWMDGWTDRWTDKGMMDICLDQLEREKNGANKVKPLR